MSGFIDSVYPCNLNIFQFCFGHCLLSLRSGSRPAEDLWKAFFVDLTLESLAAVNEARGKVASHWQSLFEKGRHPTKLGRHSRVRAFKKIATTFRRSQKVKNLMAKKGSEASTGEVKKTIEKKKKQKQPKLPAMKIHGAGSKEIEHIPSNYTRSSTGNLLIRQQMEKLLIMDKAAYPSRPMFDEDGLCRLTK